MSEMTMYFQSLERAADLAIAVNETLQEHPNAVVRYKDEEFNNEVIRALNDLEEAVLGPDAEKRLDGDANKETSLEMLFPRSSQQESDYL